MVFTAQFWGKKDFKGVQKTFGISLIVAVFFALVFTVCCISMPERILSLYTKDRAVIDTGIAYLRISALCFLPFAINFMLMITLRAIEKVKVAVGSTLVSIIVNTVLNAILIFGLFGRRHWESKGLRLRRLLPAVLKSVLPLLLQSTGNIPFWDP